MLHHLLHHLLPSLLLFLQFQPQHSEGLTFLNRLSLRVLNDHPILICIVCHGGLCSTAAADHVVTHEIPISVQDKKNLAHILDAWNPQLFMQSEDIHNPPPLLSPIDGLLIYHGFCCEGPGCRNCYRTLGSFKYHWSKDHQSETAEYFSSYHTGYVQAYFLQHPSWFEVNKVLQNLLPDDPFAMLVKDYVPTFKQEELLGPDTVNEVPMLLNTTHWHLHLADYIDTKTKVRNMRALMQLPTAQEKKGWLGVVQVLVVGYMRDIRALASKASLGIRCLLKECPRLFNNLFNLC